MRRPGEENWFRVRIVVEADGTVTREEITEAEHMADLDHILNYPYYNFRPSFRRDRHSEGPYVEFVWWRIKIYFQVWHEKRMLRVLWGDNTKPPVYWTILGIDQEAPTEPITFYRTWT